MHENQEIRLPSPWLRRDALAELPPGAGPWGFARATEKGPELVRVPDAAMLEHAIADGGIEGPYFAWGPRDENLRTIFEIDEVAGAAEARGRREIDRRLSEALPKAGAVLVAIAAAIVFRGKIGSDRDLQMLLVVGAIFFLLPLWQQGVEAAWDAWRDRRKLETDPAGWRELESRRLRFAFWVQGVKSLAGLGLAGLFVAVFLVTLLVGTDEAFSRYALVKHLVSREPWRLVTCGFLHANPVHIFFNATAGVSLAGVARILVDEKRILGVFVVSLLGSSLASCLFTPATSVGASGGILGWGGLILGIAVRHPDMHGTGLVKNMLRWVALLAAIGILGADFIDNAGHAGGFVVGLAMGALIAGRDPKPLPLGAPVLDRGFWALAVPTIGVAVWMAITLLA